MVEFCLNAVRHPTRAEVVESLFGGRQIQGEVVCRTNDGHSRLLVVRVPGMSEYVIIEEPGRLPPANETFRAAQAPLS